MERCAAQADAKRRCRGSSSGFIKRGGEGKVAVGIGHQWLGGDRWLKAFKGVA
jgi:hypothetical protein